MPFVRSAYEATEDLVGRSTGARRLFLRRGPVPSGLVIGLHVHGGDEIIRVIDGEVSFVVGGERERCTSGDLVVIPPDTEHGFAVVTDAVIEVFGEQEMGEQAVVLDGDGGRQLVEVFSTAPWSRRAEDGGTVSFDEHLAILAQTRDDVVGPGEG